MFSRIRDCIFLSLLLAFLSLNASSQVDPGFGDVQIFGVFNPVGDRLGTVVVASKPDRGFEAGNEYWSFSEESLLDIAELDSLEVAHLGGGSWDDSHIVEALDWLPDGATVKWTHPAEVEWTLQDESAAPEVAGGIHFGNPDLGGLTIQYSARGPASLTWFKLTSGPFMQLEEGALFERNDQPPTTGSWWQGPIEPTS